MALVWHVLGGDSEPGPSVPAIAEERGWDYRVARTVRLTSGRGRKHNVVQRCDSESIYRSLHREPVAVLYRGSPVVRTYPVPPFRDDRIVSISSFCRYKGLSVSLDSNDASCWESLFDEWMNDAWCDSPNDPRVLPFHIFPAKAERDLDNESERLQFRKSHRRGRIFQDQKRRQWSPARPGARHGREPQMVGRMPLPDGFHWDVTAPSASVIPSADTVWRLQSGGYINIYPDGCIRVGNRNRQEWSSEDSQREDERELRRKR